jgi:hypothetical protein
VNNENKYERYRGKFGDIWFFRYTNFISITPSYFSIYIKYTYRVLNMYAKFEKCVMYISLISG